MINPVLFNLRFIQIRWYGLIITIAILAGFLLFKYLAVKKKILTDEQTYDLSFWLIVGGIVGARVYEVIVNWHYYISDLWAVFKIWQGGIGIFGGIIGGVIALVLWSRKNFPLAKEDRSVAGRRLPELGEKFFPITDLLVISLALGQAIGRWGNYFNQELFGRPTDLPWGIFIKTANRPVEFINFTHFHPVFLYESILNFLLFFALFIFFTRKRSGRVWDSATAIYLISYGSIRFFMEFMRLDMTIIFLGLRLPQYISILLVIIGLLVIIKNYKKPVAEIK